MHPFWFRSDLQNDVTAIRLAGYPTSCIRFETFRKVKNHNSHFCALCFRLTKITFHGINNSLKCIKNDSYSCLTQFLVNIFQIENTLMIDVVAQRL